MEYMSDNSFFSVQKVPPMFGGGKRDWSVDVLRCVSCFMVCGLHAFIHTQRYGIVTAFGPSVWTDYLVNRMLFGSPTVLFVMVSGIFFLSPDRNVTAGKIWKKNVIKMTGAYLFWSLIYALYQIHIMDPQPEITPKFFIQQWLVEPYHMWYIPMILGLYMLAPVLRPITASGDTKLFRYIVTVFVIALVLSTIRDWPGFPGGETYIAPLIDKTPVAMICQYPFWMMYGWIAYTYRPSKQFRYLIYALGIAATLAGMVFNIINWYRADNLDVIATTQKFSIFPFLKNTALFYFIVTVFREHDFTEAGKKFLGKLSESTLIIYLVHMMFIYILYDNGILYGTGTMSPWIGAWIYAFIAYIGGFIVARIFHLFWDPIDPKKRKKKRLAREKEMEAARLAAQAQAEVQAEEQAEEQTEAEGYSFGTETPEAGRGRYLP